MQLSCLFFTAASLCSIAASAPVNEYEYPGVTILDQYPSKDGEAVITVYGKTTSSNLANNAIETLNRKREDCGDNLITCRGKNLADRDACHHLVKEFHNDNELVPDEPQYICTRYQGHDCCIGWADKVTDVTRGMLYPGANKVFKKCDGDTGLAGICADALLGTTCTKQCISNKPGDC
ncbi:hypothetical protein F5Y18DRAFT_432233 [Xylariaceae sp. FL1019]|nr:hypothetical protein F5Y18DRAFT_432233 [Xylariaceae sp. FL1019]